MAPSTGPGATTTPATEALLALDGIGKRFGATVALNDVSLTLRAGEVHALAGANGAGKSTLLKIIGGVHQPDRGRILLEGNERRLATPAEAREAGVATIHQELSLVGSLSITDNLLLGDEQRAWSWLRAGERRRRARAILERLELPHDPDERVEDLPLAARQLVEIARALASGARILVMDEPTSALGDEDAQRLFEHTERLRDEGRAILYVSHRMEELHRLADRVTVLRDGEVAGEQEEVEPRGLVRLMVGRDVEAVDRPPAVEPEAPVVLAAQELACEADGSRLDPLSLELRAGEILGVAGLLGSGANLVTRALFGALPAEGRLTVDGAAVPHPNPRTMLERRVMWISGDRRACLVPSGDLVDNCTLPRLDDFAQGPWLRLGARREAAAAAIERARVKHAGLERLITTLSGGNQQKVAIARAFVEPPRVLLLDEPTRGVDVAAKRDVHEALIALAQEGCAVMIAATDLDELAALCHEVLVLVDGQVTARLEAPSRAAILAAAMGARA